MYVHIYIHNDDNNKTIINASWMKFDGLPIPNYQELAHKQLASSQILSIGKKTSPDWTDSFMFLSIQMGWNQAGMGDKHQNKHNAKTLPSRRESGRGTICPAR